jgi:general secretion pathway protein K
VRTDRSSGGRSSGGQTSARGRERGVALAIVVWFIAGMSLLVAGMVSQARLDTRMAQLHVARAKAVAAGDGAIALMLAERLLVPRPGLAPANLMQDDYQIGDVSVSVTLSPEAAFVNMNSAPHKTLSVLFESLAGLPSGQANLLADNVIKWRSGSHRANNRKRIARDFKSAEDLLRVDGVNRTVFDAIRDYIVVGNNSGSVTDWTQAPEALLTVLEQVQPGEMQRILQQRETRPEANGDSPANTKRALSSAFRADALVHYGDQYWLRRRWVSLGGAATGSQLPWRFKRTEPPRVYAQRGGAD